MLINVNERTLYFQMDITELGTILKIRYRQKIHITRTCVTNLLASLYATNTIFLC